MLRIGLLGTGSMGRAHAAAYAAIPEARVTAVLDREQAQVERFARAIGAQPYVDLGAMLAAEQLDAVDCCLPTPLHRKTVEQAAAAHCSVICEKPIALTVEDGEAMIAAAERSGIQLLIGQVVRFFPEYRALAAALRDGRIGEPVTLTLLRQVSAPSGVDGWYLDQQASGGVLLDLMIHDFDWALATLGPAERVYAQVVERLTPRCFGHGTATIRHRSGAISHLTGTWGHPGPFTTMAELAGTQGLLRHHSQESAPLTLWAPEREPDQPSVPRANLSGGEDPYRTELAHFIAVLAGKEAAQVSARDALAALRVALAARRSATTGQPQLLRGDDL